MFFEKSGSTINGKEITTYYVNNKMVDKNTYEHYKNEEEVKNYFETLVKDIKSVEIDEAVDILRIEFDILSQSTYIDVLKQASFLLSDIASKVENEEEFEDGT